MSDPLMLSTDIEGRSASHTYLKGMVAPVLASVAVGAVNQAIANRTPSSVAARNTYAVAGTGLLLGLAGQAFGRSGLTLRASNGLMLGSAALIAQPLEAYVDGKYVLKPAASASTSGTAATSRVALQRVQASASVNRADLADSLDGIGL